MAHAYLKAMRPVHVPVTHCTRVQYDNRKMALRDLRKNANRNRGLVAMGVGVLQVFHCCECGLWHLGNDRKRILGSVH